MYDSWREPILFACTTVLDGKNKDVTWNKSLHGYLIGFLDWCEQPIMMCHNVTGMNDTIIFTKTDSVFTVDTDDSVFEDFTLATLCVNV